MTLPLKEPGDRIAADEWNEVAKDYNAGLQYTESVPQKKSPLYGVCPTAAPVHSIFGIYGPITQKHVDTPIVKIAPIGSDSGSLGYPFCLATNGEYPAQANKECPIEIITNGLPIKLDVAASDTGFAVGRPCGPKLNSLQASSSGVGFVCLVGPQTHQTDRKFIWAAAHDAPNLVAKTTGTIASGETTPVNATVNVQVNEGALTTDHSMSATHIGPAISDAAGKVVILIPVFGVGYVIVNPVTGGIQDIRVQVATKKLQYTKDNTNWVDWHTGTGDCPPPASP